MKTDLIRLATLWMSILGVACLAGAALLDSRRDLAIESRPAAMNLGTVDVDSSHTIPVQLINTGRRPLVVVKTRSSCGCTVARISQSRLNPREQTALTETLKAGRTPRPLVRTLFVEIANPELGLTEIVSIPISLTVSDPSTRRLDEPSRS